MKISVFVLVGSGVKIKLLPGLMDDESPVNKAVDSNVRLVKVGDEFKPRVVGKNDLFYAMDNALEALRERLTVYRYELLEDLSLLEERLKRFDTAEQFEEDATDADDKDQ